jgi:hypothetical protein
MPLAGQRDRDGRGGGDLEVQNTSFATGQQITVTSFTLTDGNA